jgi:hypothetical protein
MSTEEQKELAEKLRECLKRFDWEGLARAFHEGDMEWHAKEWSEFIRKVRCDAKEEQREEIRGRIGLLRQWLNEDRITDIDRMVDNQEIELWLFIERKKSK